MTTEILVNSIFLIMLDKSIKLLHRMDVLIGYLVVNTMKSTDPDTEESERERCIDRINHIYIRAQTMDLQFELLKALLVVKTHEVAPECMENYLAYRECVRSYIECSDMEETRKERLFILSNLKDKHGNCR